jgi:glycosyltransferase involved in cell wall biosynthesis
MNRDQGRPMLTFVLLSFNHGRYIESAVSAALAQTYSPLQVIISDDASEDDSWSKIQVLAAAYKGSHTLLLNRNPSKSGLGGHLNIVAQKAQGDWLVIASGDDLSRPDRVEKLYQRWLAAGCKAYALHSDIERIDEDGRFLSYGKAVVLKSTTPEGVVENLGFVHGATAAWHRDLFFKFPPLLPALRNEDNALTFRAALLGGIDAVAEPLVQWRLNASSLSNQIVNAQIAGRQSSGAWEAERARRKWLIARQSEIDADHASRLNGNLKKVISLRLAQAELRLALFDENLNPEKRSEYLRNALRHGSLHDAFAQFMKYVFSPLYHFYVAWRLKVRAKRALTSGG